MLSADVSAIPSGNNFGSGVTRAGEPAQNSDYMTFLTMLTAQMRNQDPLNPMQASDFAVQLATFAGVEQQSRTNDLLGSLLGQGQLADMSGLIGMEIGLPGTAWFEGGDIELQTNPLRDATEVRLIVRNEAGAIVDSRGLAAGATRYVWDGKGSDGTALAEGQYFFEVESWSGGEVLDSSAPEIYTTVREVRRDGGQIYLTLAGNLVVPAALVGSIRAPIAPTPVASVAPLLAAEPARIGDTTSSLPPQVWRSNASQGFNEER